MVRNVLITMVNASAAGKAKIAHVVGKTALDTHDQGFTPARRVPKNSEAGRPEGALWSISPKFREVILVSFFACLRGVYVVLR